MTREYAIRLADNFANGRVCSLREGEAQDYHKMCMEALLDQQEREKGCECCGIPLYFKTKQHLCPVLAPLTPEQGHLVKDSA